MGEFAEIEIVKYGAVQSEVRSPKEQQGIESERRTAERGQFLHGGDVIWIR